MIFRNYGHPLLIFSSNLFKFLVGIIYLEFFLTFCLVGFLLNGELDSSWFSRWVICSQCVGLCLTKMKIEVRVGLFMKFCVIFFCEGLVRSPITATLPQISSRLFLTWGILWSFPEVKKKLDYFIFCWTHLICLFSIQSYSSTEKLPHLLSPDSVSCACYLPTNQLVHRRGKCLWLLFHVMFKLFVWLFVLFVWC